MEQLGGNTLYGWMRFQSSLEGNPEWNARGRQRFPGLLHSFNPHSRETPSGTLARITPDNSLKFQSSLEGNPEWNARSFLARANEGVFQSSLEGNPEWNPVCLCW